VILASWPGARPASLSRCGPAADTVRSWDDAYSRARQLLEILSRDLREVADLAFHSGLTAHKVAEALGIGLENARGRIRAARLEFALKIQSDRELVGFLRGFSRPGSRERW
jgi:DNA-directed RNA polymerase specialized sigma24 family protein